MAPFEELPGQTNGDDNASALMPPPASPQAASAEMNPLSRSQSSMVGARRRPVRYTRRNAMTEGSVEAMDCFIAAMGHTEIEPAMLGRTKTITSSADMNENPRLGKRRKSSEGSINLRLRKAAAYDVGSGSDSDDAMAVHSDGEEPGSFSGCGRPPSTPSFSGCGRPGDPLEGGGEALRTLQGFATSARASSVEMNESTRVGRGGRASPSRELSPGSEWVPTVDGVRVA